MNSAPRPTLLSGPEAGNAATGVRFGRKVDFRTCRRPPAPWLAAPAAGDRLRLGRPFLLFGDRLRLGRTLLLPAAACALGDRHPNLFKLPVDTVPMI